MNSKNFKIILTLIIFLSLNCTNTKRKVFQKTFIKFDTIVTITIAENITQSKFNEIINKIIELSDKYDLIFNIYNTNSEVYKIKNFQANKKYKISKSLFELLDRTFYFYKISSGLFDPTIGIITTKNYRFDQKEQNIDISEIRNNLKLVGLTNIILIKPDFIKLMRVPVVLDLGGCAKGFIIDKISEFLKEQNIKNFMVNIGGDIYASGKNWENENWIIGIQHPRYKNEIIYKLQISNEAIVTSGDYERYIKYKGKKFHHIINPKTGLSIQNNVVSVTIIYNNTTDADFLSTTVFLLGKENGIKMINKYFNTARYVIICEEENRLKTYSNIIEKQNLL